MKRRSRFVGILLMAIGCLLLAVLLYDPSNIVAIVGLEGMVSEAGVALFGLLIVAACVLGGVAALRFRPAA